MEKETLTTERWKRRYWIISTVLILLAIPLFRSLIPEPHGMAVTFHNSSGLMIESVKLDFGNPDSQSTIRAFRIAPGQERELLLNHEPGMGFNVDVIYKGGIKQSFCALRGDEQREPVIYLKP